MDILDKQARSARMALIRSKDTKPEMAIRSMLHQMGFRFRLHRKDLPGKPDIVLPRHRKVILVHGCFWHGHEGCKIASKPKSNCEYWADKIRRNKERDKATENQLRDLGWTVLVLWECEVYRKGELAEKLGAFLAQNQTPLGRETWGNVASGRATDAPHDPAFSQPGAIVLAKQ